MTLSHWHQLKPKIVRARVKHRSPGVYLLAYGSNVRYMGRADRDLRARLLTHTGGPYHIFAFEYAA